MRILLTNDDGIHSKGIFALAKELIKFAEVIIVAPEREQSAIGHAITMHQPLRSKKINFHDMNIDAWWVSGTPADCIKLGMDFLLKEAPDVIVSGMNNGENLGKDVFYSGTVSAAIEGSFYGIKSFAVSYEDENMNNAYSAASLGAELIKDIIEWKDYPKGVVINLNIPKIEGEKSVLDWEITELGEKSYKNNFEERKDPRGVSYYWLAGEIDYDNEPEKGTDVFAMRQGKVSITPLDIYFDNKNLIKTLKKSLRQS